ncbi:MAG: acyltransferase family protein [Akkermansia sp.]|nr:acyltransferase family protein [Akkermansia sp.]
MDTIKTSSTGRDPYWDIVKGLLIFLVLFGHSIQIVHLDFASRECFSHPLFKAIYIFHMPLFALVSGYFSVGSISRRGARQIFRAATHLLIPCLTMVAIDNAKMIYLFFKEASALNFRFLEPFGSLWFLICIFECCIFMCILLYRTSWWWRSFWCVFPIALAVFTPAIPWARFFVFIYPFYLLGAYMYSKRWNVKNVWVFILSSVAFVCVNAIFAPVHYVYSAPLNYESHDWVSWLVAAIRFVGGLAGCLCFLYLATLLCRLSWLKVIRDIGKYTLAIYVLQSIFFSYVWLNYFPTVHLNLLLSFVFAVLLLFLLYGCTLLINKSRVLKFFIFGETK